jgi:Radical SAM superfamily/4Fe-4S single cluster domain
LHNPDVDHRKLYRLPWTSSDNVISWLEPTAKCNLSCEGCYRENVNEHKSLEEVRKDLDVFNTWRNYDGVSIAGGDPLLHPNIVDIVKMVKADGHKPILNTNGLALTDQLLRDLKDAGLVGFTFHIDSRQGRPGWKNKTELELNELRLQLAKKVASVGGVSCAFNATIYEDTLQYVPELVQFAQDHIDIIDVMVFIVYRAAVQEGEFQYYYQGKAIDPSPLVYSVEQKKQRIDLTSREVVRTIRTRFPDFEPSAYLNGTENPTALKWLYTGRYGIPGKIFGYVGPKFMETVQSVNHFVNGKYLAYAPKSQIESGRSAMLGMGLIEPGTREAFKHYARHLMQKPLDVTKKVYFQTVMIIQPIDILEDGRQSMCDGCPDVTVHEGKLVWSCRLEEYKKYGGLCQSVPRAACSHELPVKLPVVQPAKVAVARR